MAMTRLKPGALLRCEWNEHIATVYDVDGNYLDELEPAKGDVVMFLHYDDYEQGRRMGLLDAAEYLRQRAEELKNG